MNLNGTWQFEIDRGNSGAARKLYDDAIQLKQTITIPFCPQSRLSGIADTDFMTSVWYKRTVELPDRQLQGKAVLHFGAVDYRATVYVNGVRCGTHQGGYVSFGFDVTEYLRAGVNTITVHAEDNERDRMIPTGKQSGEYASHGCMYTRTTGIWQTVWLEFLPETHITKVKYYPSFETGNLVLTADLCGASTFCAEAFYDGRSMGKVSAASAGEPLVLTLELAEKHLWELGKGGLHDLVLTYGEDKVRSYFGLRSIDYHDRKFYLNGRSVFQRLVLDQGFYPDGIYTAPSDAELAADIDRAVAMGFNGARLHQKVFEERFLYHCDRKGYLVWGEFPSWGLDHSYPDAIYGILPEWLEVLDRDFNHPAIVGWCPFNETWDRDGRKQYDALLATVYKATKAADPTRPCIDASGNYHVLTDIYDVHNYEQNPETFAEHYRKLALDGSHTDHCGQRQRYDNHLPFFVSEYGGIRWTDSQDGWGYGRAPQSSRDFLARLKGLTDVLLDNPAMFAFCYTQLTDVEQEQNGLYTYDRKAKFDPALMRPIFSRKAQVEE
ncbi:MAG: sugar-binding domain-containing protein [Eubacteriales bacterium]